MTYPSVHPKSLRVRSLKSNVNVGVCMFPVNSLYSYIRHFLAISWFAILSDVEDSTLRCLINTCLLLHSCLVLRDLTARIVGHWCREQNHCCIRKPCLGCISIALRCGINLSYIKFLLNSTGEFGIAPFFSIMVRDQRWIQQLQSSLSNQPVIFPSPA